MNDHFSSLKFLFWGLPSEHEASETITALAKIVKTCISAIDLNSSSAYLGIVVILDFFTTLAKIVTTCISAMDLNSLNACLVVVIIHDFICLMLFRMLSFTVRSIFMHKTAIFVKQSTLTNII